MNKLAEMITEGKITVEELAGAEDLIARAKLVTKGIEACKKNILFPIGTSSISCYHYTDSYGEYESWGECTMAGTFTCYSNWGGTHKIGQCNLLSFKEVFLAFDEHEFYQDIKRFLEEQIEKANPAKVEGTEGAR